MQDIDTFLKTLGYTSPKYDVYERDSIVDLIPKTRRCGIYVLHFANDEYYAGLSINVQTRFNQHCKTYDDIQFLSFKVTTLKTLRKEEERIIKKLEKAGYRLRNKVHTSITVSSSPFDEIMDNDEQERWIQDVNSNDFSGERYVDEDLRRKYSRNFQQLTQLPHGSQAIDVFRQYVQQCIPVPLRTELYYWSVSCLPGNTKTLYVRLNIKQEVLRITKSANGIDCVIFVAKSLYQHDNVLKNMLQTGKQFIKFSAILVGKAMYEAGGQDQLAIRVNGADNAMRVLQDGSFVRAARTLNLRIMRKSFNLQYRYHCYDLADKMLEGLND